MLALVYRFSKDPHGPSKIEYLREYQYELMKARIRFEQLDDIDQGISVIQDFHNSRTPPGSFLIASELKRLTGNKFVKEYLLLKKEGKKFIQTIQGRSHDELRENERRLESLREFYKSYLPNDEKAKELYNLIEKVKFSPCTQ